LKQQILKALANPPRIFFVPYSLAVLNFLIEFIIFFASMIIFLVFTSDIPMWLPTVFLSVLCIVHSILGIFCKKDPQLAQIISAKFKLFRNKIPRRLIA